MSTRPDEIQPQAQHTITRRQLLAILAAGALALALFTWLLSVFHPLPPHSLTLATGPDGSSYAVFGKRYKSMLAKQGIVLNLRPTAGAVENLALLNDPKSGVQLGFVDGGLTKPKADDDDDGDLVSLGTLCYEPLWFFTRNVPTDTDLGLSGLHNKRVSVGPQGSVSQAMVDELIKRKALDIGSFKRLTLTPEDSAEALLQGRIDAVVLVSSYASPVVRKLAKADGIDLASFNRADAYAAIFPALTKRNFPAGVADLLNYKPSADVTLLATKTSLVAREDLHPALQYLLLDVIAQVHARNGIFQKAGEFPAAESLDVPLSDAARHYYKSGRPFLQRFMPFWLAAMVEQLALLLLPILGLTYPLVKGLWALYGWGMQRRIFALYGELHWVESQIDQLGARPAPQDLRDRMVKLRERTHRVRVPAKFMPLLYSLKDTLASVGDRLDRQGS